MLAKVTATIMFEVKRKVSINVTIVEITLHVKDFASIRIFVAITLLRVIILIKGV